MTLEILALSSQPRVTSNKYVVNSFTFLNNMACFVQPKHVAVLDIL
jgi:hypothetical protein